MEKGVAEKRFEQMKEFWTSNAETAGWMLTNAYNGIGRLMEDLTDENTDPEEIAEAQRIYETYYEGWTLDDLKRLHDLIGRSMLESVRENEEKRRKATSS